MKFLGSKTIKTDRLIIRKIRIDDAYKAYENWCSNDEVVRYVLWEKHKNIETTIDLYSKWIDDYNNKKTFRWIVELKSNHDLIGTIDVSSKFITYGSCEIGYCFGSKFWNQGYATEALTAVIRFLFIECEAELIYADHMKNNPASGKVMQKSGLTYEATLKSRVIDKYGIRNDLVVYSITRDEYLKKTNICNKKQ